MVLRFVATSALWLDEAQSVAIARLPFHDLLAALRQDGSPPLYYLLLHSWMAVFGQGAVAVRALSGLFSVAALPVAWVAARRVGLGRRGAVAATLLLATSPYALRYATETRMYSLLLLLVLLGVVALVDLHREPSPPRAAAVAVVAAALVTTHYWSFFLVGVVGLAHLVLLRRPDRRAAAAWTVGALAAAGLVFLPWLPSFLYQLRHTGTPWAAPPGVGALPQTVSAWASAGRPGPPVLAFGYWVLFLIGAAGAFRGRRRPPAWRLAAVTAGTLVVALVLSDVTGGAYVLRYTAVALPTFLLTVAAGSLLLPERWWRPALAVLVAAGLAVGGQLVGNPRTEARGIAAAINAEAAPGDVVAYCPDQLGPAVSRLLHVPVKQYVYPTFGPPQRVDWVDYAKRNESADPLAIARGLVARAHGHDIWLVWATGYRTFGGGCTELTQYLGFVTDTVPTDVVPLYKGVLEHERLTHWALR